MSNFPLFQMLGEKPVSLEAPVRIALPRVPKTSPIKFGFDSRPANRQVTLSNGRGGTYAR